MPYVAVRCRAVPFDALLSRTVLAEVCNASSDTDSSSSVRLLLHCIKFSPTEPHIHTFAYDIYKMMSSSAAAWKREFLHTRKSLQRAASPEFVLTHLSSSTLHQILARATTHPLAIVTRLRDQLPPRGNANFSTPVEVFSAPPSQNSFWHVRLPLHCIKFSPAPPHTRLR